MKVDDVLPNLNNELKGTKTLNELENIIIKYLGRNGLIHDLLTKIKNIDISQRKEYGQKINNIKNSINQLIEQKKTELVNKKNEETTVDITLPGKRFPKGSLHVITIAIEEISKIFQKIGFIRMSYPEVDWDFFAFETLNMPRNHPARDDFETSFIDYPENKKWGKMVLTPHTSNGQVREMWRVGAPIRMINIAKCYRPNWDPTHTPMFFQFEGLCVDKGINITHLKGTLDYFAKEYFGPDCQTRLRPHHFQFTEPSFEMDITCTVCKGTGYLRTPEVPEVAAGTSGVLSKTKCKVCKSGWLELGGCGMVHPAVLKAGKIDPGIYTGWAFGFGIERVIMIKYGIEDIRYYYNGDIRFLEQF